MFWLNKTFEPPGVSTIAATTVQSEVRGEAFPSGYMGVLSWPKRLLLQCHETQGFSVSEDKQGEFKSVQESFAEVQLPLD